MWFPDHKVLAPRPQKRPNLAKTSPPKKIFDSDGGLESTTPFSLDDTNVIFWVDHLSHKMTLNKNVGAPSFWPQSGPLKPSPIFFKWHLPNREEMPGMSFNQSHDAVS